MKFSTAMILVKKELLKLRESLFRFRARLRGSTWLNAALKYLLLYLVSAFYTFFLLQVTVAYGKFWGLGLLLLGLFLFGVYLLATGIIETDNGVSAKIKKIKGLLLTRLEKTIKL